MEKIKKIEFLLPVRMSYVYPSLKRQNQLYSELLGMRDTNLVRIVEKE